MYLTFTVVTGAFNHDVAGFPNGLHVINGVVEAAQITAQIVFILELKEKVLPRGAEDTMPGRQVRYGFVHFFIDSNVLVHCSLLWEFEFLFTQYLSHWYINLESEKFFCLAIFHVQSSLFSFLFQVTVFLFFLNFAQWIIFTFEIQKVRASMVEAEFYGFMPWVIIQRVTLPLTVFFRCVTK